MNTCLFIPPLCMHQCTQTLPTAAPESPCASDMGMKGAFRVAGVMGVGKTLDMGLIQEYNHPMKKPDETKFNARFPNEVYQALRALAKEHQRSINSELVWIVREYIERQKKH